MTIRKLVRGLFARNLESLSSRQGRRNPERALQRATLEALEPRMLLTVFMGMNSTSSTTMTVTGWAYDSTAPATSTYLEVFVGGIDTGQAIPTNVLRTDVNTAFGLTGNHGFNWTFQDYTGNLNLGSGNHTVTLKAKDKFGTITSASGTQTIHAPNGFLDSASGHTARLQGWAFDPNSGSASTYFDVFSDNTLISRNQTSVYRAGVNSTYGITGDHGFDLTVDGAALNWTPGSTHNLTVSLWNQSLTGRVGDGQTQVVHVPLGVIDAAGPSGPTIQGWTYDPDNSSASTTVDFWVDGVDFGSTTTNVLRSDVNSAYSISGNHGFSFSFNGLLGAGPHVVDIYGFDSTGATRVKLGTVDVADVTSSVASGSYHAGQLIPIQFMFPDVMTVTGTPTLTLATGAPGGTVVNYVSGSGTNTLIFNYTVAAGQNTGLLDYVTGAALNFPSGAAIIDGSNKFAWESPGVLGSLETNKNIVIDTIVPNVSSINVINASPTNGGSVSWAITFSEDVSGVNLADFQLVQAGGVSTASITSVTGSGDSYIVTASTGIGDGTLGLNLSDDDSITDTAGNKLGGTGTGNGDFSGQVYVIDKTAPTIASIVRSSTVGNPSNASSVSFVVTFSEAVTGVNTSDFSPNIDTGVTGAAVSSVTGSGNTYTITVDTGIGDGTVGLKLAINSTVSDVAGNALTDVTPGLSETFTIDKTSPPAPSVNRITGSTNPTNASSVSYTVIFAEPVTGVDVTDFAVATTGLTGAAVSSMSGSSTTYTVVVNTGTGDGTLQLILVDDDSVQDAATNPLGGVGLGNGNVDGQVYVIDHTPPVVTSITAGGTSPTHAASVNYTVTFSEAVSGVDASDFALAVSGVSGASITGVSGSGDTYTVSVGTGSDSGTLGLNLVDDDSIVDGVGNKLGGTGADTGSYTGETYTIDRAGPAIVTAATAIIDAAGSVATLDVLGGSTYGEGTLNYTWSVVGASGATVQFSSNGDNAAKHTTATFSSSGSYTFTVLITDSENGTVTSATTISVVQALADLVAVGADPAPGSRGTQHFYTLGYDQFGRSMVTQPAVTWSVSGTGYSIDSSGVLTAPDRPSAYSVTATSGSFITTLAYNSTITVTSPALATLDETGTTATLSLAATLPSDPAGSTYSWFTTSTSPADVSFSDNGTPTAATTTALLSAAGTYGFLVKITDANGTSITSSVTLVVSQNLTTIGVSTTDNAPAPNGTQQFSAIGYDQFGNALSTQPAFSWSVAGDGYSISSSGLLTAPDTSASYNVTASSGTLTSDPVAFSPSVSLVRAANATIDSSGAIAALDVLATDTIGGSDLTYIWSVTGTPPAGVWFYDNGTSTANQTIAVFSAAGTYDLSVTGDDGHGDTITSTVSVIVAQVTSSIVVSTSQPTPAANGTQQVSAIAYDQFSNEMATQPAFTWAVNGDGYSVSSSGLLTAGATPGEYSVMASVGDVDSTPISFSQIITVATTPAAIVGTTNAAVSVLGAATAGEASLYYTWSTAGPSAGDVSFADNGTNSAKATTATFSAAGTYLLQVVISDIDGDSTTTFLSIVVSQQLTSIIVKSADPTPVASDTQQFSAVAYDQFDNQMATQPSVIWAVDGTGYTISSDGLLAAGSTVGSYSVTAASGIVTSDALHFDQSLALVNAATVTIDTQSNTFATLSVLGTDALGGSDLVYSWSVTSGSASNIIFLDNGDNTAHDTVAEFLAAGTYTFLATITDLTTGSVTSFATVTVDQSISGITITAVNAAPSAGQTQQFSAVAYDQFGQAMSTQPTFSWAVTGTGYTISSSGLLTAPSNPGDYSVTASSGTVESATLPFSHTLTVASGAYAALNSTATAATLTVLGSDPAGESSLTYVWSTTGNSPSGVSFADNATNTAKSTTATFSEAGAYTFIVTIIDADGLETSSNVSITVTPALTGILLAPATPTPAANDTQQITAIGYDQFGQALSAQPTMSWSISGTGYSISSDGLVTAGSTVGNYTVTASSGSITQTLDFAQAVTVTSAATSTLDSSGTFANIAVAGAGPSGSAGLTYIWSVTGGDASNVGFEDNYSGTAYDTVADFYAPGTYTLTATIEDGTSSPAISSTTITVSSIISFIDVTSTDSIPGASGTQQFSAAAFDQFGHALATQPTFSWSVAGSGYSIDSNGELTAGSTTGGYTVTVDGGGQSGSSDPGSIAPSIVAPAAAAVSSDGITAALSVQASDMSNGSDLTYSWSSDDDSVSFADDSATTTATFDAAGTYKLTVAITNEAGLSVSSNVSVTVDQLLTSIIITSDNPPVLSGATSSFTAEADDQFGARLAKQPSFTWSVTGAGNSIDGSGKATAGATPGSFTVTATSGSVSATGALGIYFAAFTPHLQDQSASISLNSPTGFSIIQGDTNGDPAGDTYVPYYVGLTGGPTHGQVTVHQDGTATYAPDHNFIGSDTFTIATYNADWLGGSENVTVDVTGDAPDSYDPGEPSLMTWGDGQDPNEGTSVTLGEHDNAWLAYGTKSIAVSNETADPVTFSIAGNTVTIVSTNASLVHDVEVDPTISLAAALSVNWTNSNSSDFLTVVANNAGNVTTAGSVTLYANNLTGAFNVGTMSAGIDGTFSGTIQSAGGVALSAWDIAGNITTTSSDIHVTARGDISGRIEAGGSVDASANGDVTNAASLIADTGSVGVTAFGDIAGTITGSTGVTVTAGAENVDPDGGAVSGQITCGNLISEDGDIEITGDQISATVNAIGATSIGIVASGNFSGTANGADGLVNVNVKDDVTGAVNGNGNIEISAGRDISGAVHSSSGDIVQLLAGGDISGNADADAGRINQVTAGGTISGDMTAQEDIGGSGTSGLFGITAGVDITGTITSNSGDIYLVQALRDMNGEVTADSGELHLAKGGRDVDGDGISADTIDSVVAGRDLDTDVESTEALGTVSAGRTIDGDITSDNSSIGGVAAGSGWSDAFTTSGKINGSTIEAGTGIGNVTVSAALNYDGAIKNATITANDGFIGNITAVSGIDVTATASESIGNITTPRGDISGSVTATMGDIGDVSANAGSISAALTAGEDIGNILAGTNISGAIEAQRNIATGTGQSITAVTGGISGNITSDQGSIGSIYATSSISGNIEAQDQIANVTALQGAISGTITSDSGNIGEIFAGASVSGSVTAHGNIGSVTAGMIADGSISGNLTTNQGSIGDIFSGGSINGSINVADSIASVTAIGDISQSITAGGSIGAVSAGGDISGSITAHRGYLAVTSWGRISGAISGQGGISVFANGVFGSVTSSGGNITLQSLGNVSGGTIHAMGSISLWAGQDIGGSVESAGASVWAFAMGNIYASISSAAGAVSLEAVGRISQGNINARYGVNAFSWGGGTTISFGDVQSSFGSGTPAETPICFARGTRILMADGSSRAIETIEVGLQVLTVPESDGEGKLEPRKVLEVYHNDPQPIWQVHIDGQTIRATASHPFYVKGHGWRRTQELKAGDQLRTPDGASLQVQAVANTGQVEPVFNLEVEANHTYFVLLPESNKAVLVHNQCAEEGEAEELAAEMTRIAEETAARQRELEREAEEEHKSVAEVESEAEALAAIRARTLDRMRARGEDTNRPMMWSSNLKEARESEAEEIKQEQEELKKQMEDLHKKEDDKIQKGLEDPKTNLETLKELSKAAKQPSPFIRKGMQIRPFEGTTFYGTEQVTDPKNTAEIDPHARDVLKHTKEEAAKGDVSYASFNRSIWTSSNKTLPGNERPDVYIVRTNGKIDLGEVVSPGQTEKDQREKLEAIMATWPDEIRGKPLVWTIQGSK